MKKPKLIIFDLDGTLVDAYKAIAASVNFSLLSLGYPAKKFQAIKRSVGWGETRLFFPEVEKKYLAGIIHIYRRHHKGALLKYSRILPGTLRVLKYLRKNEYKLAIASNRPTKYCLIILKHLGLLKYFDYVLCADKLKYKKPHPQILRRIIRHFKVIPARTVYIGDMAIDAQAGKRAKIRTIIVPTGSSSKKEIAREKPWKVIARQTDLLKLF
jgi:phosphoglycolate phosphatase